MKKNQRRAGVILSYAGQAVQVLTGLLYTPVMIRILGQSEYGLYQFAYSIVSYLGLLNLGFNASYMRFYSREKISNKKDAVERLNGMFMLIFLIMSVAVIACGILIVSRIELVIGTAYSSYDYQKIRVLMLLMVVTLAVSFPNSVFTCIVTSQERFVFQKLLVFLQNLLNPFLTLPLLLLGYGSIGVALVSLFLTLTVFITNMFFCFKVLKVKFSFRNLQYALLKEMGIFTFYIFLNQVIDQINWSVDKYLLGRLSGVVDVAIYSVGSQINLMYLQLSTAVSNVYVPQINKIVAENGNDDELTALFIKIGRIQFMILSLILTGFIFFGRPFVKFWVGVDYNDSYLITLLLIAPVTIPLIQNIGIEIQRAKNKHKVRSWVYMFIAVVNILISIPLIKLFGPIGAAIGTAISMILGNGLFMNWYYYKNLGINILGFWKSLFDFAPTLIVSTILGVISLFLVGKQSIISLMICIIIYSSAYFLLLYFTGMNNDEKYVVKVMAGRIRFNRMGTDSTK